MNANWTGKLKVALIFGVFSWKKVCSHNFKASLEEALVKYSEKTKAKYIKQYGILHFYYDVSSSEIIFRDFD